MPDVVIAADKWVDREYYKIIPGFLWSSERRLMSQRIAEWSEWTISCEKLPDKIVINGEEYKLIKKK